MTDTMLTRMARAILEEDAKNATARVRSSMWTNGRETYIGLAKAALEAIRGDGLEGVVHIAGTQVNINVVKDAIIDAILQGEV